MCAFRPRGERLQHCQPKVSEAVQPGAPAAFPQRRHHRGGAGGTDAAVRRRDQEGQTQGGRLAGDGVRSIQDGSDGTTRRSVIRRVLGGGQEPEFFLCVCVCVSPDAVHDPGSSTVTGEAQRWGNRSNISNYAIISNLSAVMPDRK